MDNIRSFLTPTQMQTEGARDRSLSRRPIDRYELQTGERSSSNSSDSSPPNLEEEYRQ